MNNTEIEVLVAFVNSEAEGTMTRKISNNAELDIVIGRESPYYEHMRQTILAGGAVLLQDKRRYDEHSRLGITAALCHINSTKQVVLLGYGLPEEDQAKLFNLRGELYAHTGVVTEVCLHGLNSSCSK
jgi:hypothetical protein